MAIIGPIGGVATVVCKSETSGLIRAVKVTVECTCRENYVSGDIASADDIVIENVAPTVANLDPETKVFLELVPNIMLRL